MTPADLTPADVKLARSIAHAAASRLSAHVRSRVRDDVESDALLGLVKAAASFDPSRGVPFGAYATRRIKGEIGDGYRRAGFSDRGPGNVYALNAEDDDGPWAHPEPVDYGNTDPIAAVNDRISYRQTVTAVGVRLAPRLTGPAWEVWIGLTDGKPAVQIAAERGVTEGAVSHTVKVIRRQVADLNIRLLIAG